MGAARSPEQLKLHCPTCGDELVPSRSGDPLVLCLACRAKHRFFIVPKPPSAAATSNAASMRLPHLAGQSPDTVAAFWLSDKAARSVLNEQLAELLRVAVENRRVPYDTSFVQCPLCGERLAEYEQPDVWVQGLRCPNSHSCFAWWSPLRHGTGLATNPARGAIRHDHRSADSGLAQRQSSS